MAAIIINAPLPWSFVCPAGPRAAVIEDANLNDVAEVYGETRSEAAEVAAEIARRVNRYDDLVAALRAVTVEAIHDYHLPAMTAARDLLSKLEG